MPIDKEFLRYFGIFGEWYLKLEYPKNVVVEKILKKLEDRIPPDEVIDKMSEEERLKLRSTLINEIEKRVPEELEKYLRRKSEYERLQRQLLDLEEKGKISEEKWFLCDEILDYAYELGEELPKLEELLKMSVKKLEQLSWKYMKKCGGPRQLILE